MFAKTKQATKQLLEERAQEKRKPIVVIGNGNGNVNSPSLTEELGTVMEHKMQMKSGLHSSFCRVIPVIDTLHERAHRPSLLSGDCHAALQICIQLFALSSRS